MVRIEQGSTHAFEVAGDPSYRYTWNPSSAFSCSTCPGAELQPGNYPAVIELTVEDSLGCSSAYNIRPEYICSPYLPNAFSPNDDGRNDTFFPFIVCPNATYTLQVFDRWGSMIFESTADQQEWDGQFDGKAAPVGVYVYVVQLATDFSQETFYGEVNLVR